MLFIVHRQFADTRICTNKRKDNVSLISYKRIVFRTVTFSGFAVVFYSLAFSLEDNRCINLISLPFLLTEGNISLPDPFPLI